MKSDRKEQPARSKEQLRIGQPFNPYKLFTGIFIPEALVRYRGLSPGGKLVYGRFARYAGEDGGCWPAIPTLAAEIGIGTTQTRIYVHELKKKRFIAIEERPGASGIYKFLWHEAFAGAIGDRRKAPPLRKTGGVPLRKSGGAPLRKTVPPPLRKTGDEENHHQESQVKESHLEEKQALPLSRKSEPSKPSILHSLDDEKTHPEGGSPWEQLCTDFRRANRGEEMSCLDERWLKENMEQRNITPEALLELVRSNPLAGFDSPMAGLKWLVKRFRSKTHTAASIESAVRRQYVFERPLENARCEKCANTGRVLERPEEDARPRVTDQYCECAMGKDLKAVEKRRKEPVASVQAPRYPVASQRTDDLREATQHAN